MIRIEIIFSHFKSIPLGASGEGFRKQTKEGKSLFTLRGLVSCDANETSFELPLLLNNMFSLEWSRFWSTGCLIQLFASCYIRGMAHTGLNLPKRFTNYWTLAVLTMTSDFHRENKKSCLGCKQTFVFCTCPPHFTLGLAILVAKKSDKSM